MTENDGREHLGSILCLGGSQESLPIIQKVMEMGYRPIVLDGNKNCAAVGWVKSKRDERIREIRRLQGLNTRNKYKKYDTSALEDANRIPVFIRADCYNYDSCHLALIHAVRKEGWKHGLSYEYFTLENLVGVLCCAIDAPLVATRLAEKYRLPTIGSSAIKYGVNKFYQWQVLTENGILVPPTRVVNPEMSWVEVLEYNLVKPVDSRGARGVRFYGESDYREAFVESLGWSKEGMIIAQKFIPGQQLSTESVIYNGEVSMTSAFLRNYDRLQEFHPYIVEDGGESMEPTSLNRNINLLIERCCRVLGWNNCTVKGDLILDGNLLYVLELAPRLSGGYLSTHSTRLSMGWDIVGDAIRLATGGKPALQFDPAVGGGRFVAQRYIFPPQGYVGRVISELPQFPPSVNFGTWNVKVGDVIQKVQHHPSRLGQVIMARESQNEAIAGVNEIVAELTKGIKVE